MGAGQARGAGLQGVEGRGQVWLALIGGPEGPGGRLYAGRFLHCSVQATFLNCKTEVKTMSFWGLWEKIINNSVPNCSGANVLGAVSFKLPLNCW